MLTISLPRIFQFAQLFGTLLLSSVIPIISNISTIMELTTKSSSIVFVNTLQQNPSAQWPKFYREAKQIAWRLMQEYPGFPAGLLYLVIPLAEYNTVPQVTVGGQILAPTVPIYPADLTPQSTASSIATYRIEVDLCVHYFRTLESFKSAVLTAMGFSGTTNCQSFGWLCRHHFNIGNI